MWKESVMACLRILLSWKDGGEPRKTFEISVKCLNQHDEYPLLGYAAVYSG
jgi:hypothetical protein